MGVIMQNNETLADKINDASVERGSVGAENSKKAGSKVKNFMLAGVVILVILFLLFGYLFAGGKSDETPSVEDEPEVASTTPRSNFRDDMEKMMREAMRAQPPESPTPSPSAPVPELEPTSDPVYVTTTPESEPEPEPEPDENELRRLRGDVMIFSGSKEGGMTADDREEATSASPLNEKMTRATTPSVKAQSRKDLTYLLRKGTNIACTLNSKIVTTQQGFTRCYVNKDVYSANGRVLLIERGSEIIGEQTSSLLQGQTRVFVMWHAVETPTGVRIDIDSPTAGKLGEAGAEAQIQTHFWKRFGGAIMLSMIDDVMGIASNRIDNKEYQFNNTQDNVQGMAEEALRNTINIPPTGYVNQGTLLNIIVARDVDFKDVYKLVNF